MISVIIPTFKEQNYLDLCVSSALENQSKENQVVVVFDGEESRMANSDFIEEYSDKVVMASYPKNEGMCKALNVGSHIASGDNFLIVNDDHVFPKDWDSKIIDGESGINDGHTITTFNTIEHNPSTYKYFECLDFGKDPETFKKEEFFSFVPNHCEIDDENYANLPFMIGRVDWHVLGGWDQMFPNGMIADFDFFLRAKKSGLRLVQNFDVSFYHFGSTSVNDRNLIENGMKSRTESEMIGRNIIERKFGKEVRIDNQNIITERIS